MTAPRIPTILGATGVAAFLSLSSGVAGWLPISESTIPRLFQRMLIWFDAPISAVGLLLPFQGAWLFFVPIGDDRGINPDVFGILANQLLIGVPTYLAIFWLVAKAYGGLKTR